MENKTAVEWLIEQINQKSFEIDNGYPIITIEDVNELALQALEIEKQQIAKAVNETQVRCIKTANSILKKGFGMDDMFEFDFDMAEQYYKDNYKKNKDEVQNNDR